MRWKLSLPLFVISLLFAANLSAQTVYIPVDFGGFSPIQINRVFLNSALSMPNSDMLDEEARVRLLGSRFTEIIMNDVMPMEKRLETAIKAYHSGEIELAISEFSALLETATDHLTELSLRPGLSFELFNAGAYLMQIQYFVKEDVEATRAVADRMIRLFPTRKPEGEQFPDELALIYRERMPRGMMGHELKLISNTGCDVRVNGHRIPSEQASLGFPVYAGLYAVSKVCGQETVRNMVIPIYDSTVIDFEDAFHRAFNYPIGVSLRADVSTTSLDSIVEDLVKIGRRLEVPYVVGLGLVPIKTNEFQSGYTAIYVDVNMGKLIRLRSAHPGDVSSAAGMDDMTNSVFKGGGYKKIDGGPAIGALTVTGITSLSLGVATLIAGSVTGVLAMKEDDKLQKARLTAEDRRMGRHFDAVEKRDKYAKLTDIFIGTGVGLVGLGVTLWLVDQFVIQPASDDPYRASRFGVDAQIGPESFGLNFSMDF